ncbi:unnamed protein product [Amaranthus hypochondriacus]
MSTKGECTFPKPKIIEIGIRMGYSFVHIEGDNSTVIEGIHNKAQGCSPPFVLLDLVLQLSQSFLGFKCSSIRRSGNTVAHMVARWNAHTVGENVYMNPFLQSLVTLATLDL